MIDAKIKSRRLGYLKVLAKFSLTNDNWNTRLFSKRFEDYALLFEKSFSLLTEQSGVIVSNNGKSAEPYVRMAESLEFLIRSNREYLVSDEFRVYASTIASLTDGNIFFLNLEEIQFFLNRLVQFDGEIIRPLLITIINQDEQDNATSIRRKFFTNLTSLNSQISLGPKMTINRIGRSKFYIDELFHPRLHWLLDLNVVYKDTNGKIVLTGLGHQTCNSLGLH